MILHPERLNGVKKLLYNFASKVAFKTLDKLNRNILIVYGYRNNGLQTALYAQGREDLSKVNELRHIAGTYPITEKENKRTVTNANAGQSPHNYYMAIDIACMKEKSIKEIDWNNVSFWKIVEKEVAHCPELFWGGNFKIIDKPHIEIKDWKKIICF